MGLPWAVEGASNFTLLIRRGLRIGSNKAMAPKPSCSHNVHCHLDLRNIVD